MVCSSDAGPLQAADVGAARQYEEERSIPSAASVMVHGLRCARLRSVDESVAVNWFGMKNEG
jgi:hypothetical protein